MTEDKASRYHRLKRGTEIAALVWGGLLTAGLLASGAAHRLAAVAAWVAGGRFAVTIAVLVVLLTILNECVALPLSWYSGFVLERRYDLSRQTPLAWLADHVKATLLSLGLGIPAALLVYATMALVPAWWWLASGAIFAGVIVGLARLAPVVLLPLFFSFSPLGRADLRARLEALAARAGTRVVGVYEWALGAKTAKANAALAGLGASRRILVSDTMLEQYSDDEIAVVLAHELGHHVHHDIWRSLAVESLVILLGFLAADAALVHAGPALGLSGIADPAGLPLLLLAAGGVSLLLTPAGLALSRRHERAADRFALEITGDAEAFVSAMRRLGAQNLAEEQPSRLTEWLFLSHPPLAERLAAAHAWKQAGPN